MPDSFCRPLKKLVVSFSGSHFTIEGNAKWCCSPESLHSASNPELPHRQRVDRSPGDAAFRIEAVELSTSRSGKQTVHSDARKRDDRPGAEAKPRRSRAHSACLFLTAQRHASQSPFRVLQGSKSPLHRGLLVNDRQRSLGKESVNSRPDQAAAYRLSGHDLIAPLQIVEIHRHARSGWI
jgi:hypothetical protein